MKDADADQCKRTLTRRDSELRWCNNEWFQPIRISDTGPNFNRAKCNGNVISVSAAEIWSPGRQMWPMNPPGDPRSYHRWSVWRPMAALGFAENVLEWKGRGDSTDALISNLHCSLVKCGPRLVHFEYFWLVAWSQQIIDWRTTQNWDGPPNQQPWVVH